MNNLFKALYRHRLIMKATGPIWIVRGQSLDRYSADKGKILDTDFISIDGEVWHIKSGPRPKGYYEQAIPFELFIKDEAGV